MTASIVAAVHGEADVGGGVVAALRHAPELGLYFAKRGSDIVGVVPMYVEQLAWPPLGARVGKPVGAAHSTSNFGFVGVSSVAPLVLATVAIDMIGSFRRDFVSYGPMPDAAPVSRAIAHSGLVADDVAVSTCPHTPESLRASEVSLDRLRIVGSGRRRRVVAGASKQLA